MEIAAERLVDVGPGAVFAFLSDPEKHWVLASRFVELVSLDLRGGVGDGGTVRLRGPLRLRRTATTRVVAVSDGQLVGSAQIGRRTRATLQWTLSPREDGTVVRQSATPSRSACQTDCCSRRGESDGFAAPLPDH